MGGFTINGIGATDHFKKLKSLGVRTCPNCGKQAEFFIELVKFKIDILYIPTFTLKTRYAVMCSKCERGQSVSDAWAAKLLADGPHDVIFESGPPTQTTQQDAAAPQQPVQDPAALQQPAQDPAALQQSAQDPAAPQQPAQETAAPQQPAQDPAAPQQLAQETAALQQPAQDPAAPQQPAQETVLSKGAAMPSFFKCPSCGVTQIRSGEFCAYCGTRAPQAQQKPAQIQPVLQLACPYCGAPMKPGAVFCDQCGKKLT